MLISPPGQATKFLVTLRWFLLLQDKEGTDLAEQVGCNEAKEQNREDMNMLGSFADFEEKCEGSQATA